MTVAGHEINEELYRSERTVVYRGRRSSDGQPVILKTTSNPQPTNLELGRLSHEFSILQLFNSPRIVRPHGVEKMQSSRVLILEDIQGVPLGQYLSMKSPDLQSRLKLAIEIARGLADIHQKNVIHKDLKPQNLLVNPTTGTITLIDFDLANQITEERHDADDEIVFGGTLAYISPEQTGRMNCGLDYRTDYYSLGITLYEMFTGGTPFTFLDSMEFIHAHLAHEPQNPRERNSELSENFAKIVLKLLEKRPENRYQSTRGLIHDLECCLAETQGKTVVFELGKLDVPEQFRLSDKLYGREDDLKHIQLNFQALAEARPEISPLILVSGPSGIGKSSLIAQVKLPILEVRGSFAEGKYDLLSRDIPYSGLLQALRDLTRRLFLLSEWELTEHKRALWQAIGAQAPVLAERIPELRGLLPAEAASLKLEDLPTRESQNRFHQAVQSFLRVFSRSRTVVLFLDDLQWADANTFQILEFLLKSRDNKNLMVIGAYRNNEVNEFHPLFNLVTELTTPSAPLLQITLTPLTRKDIQNLLSDSLYAEPNSLASLAGLVHSRTEGNPFFVSQFLYDLKRSNFLVFDRAGGQWTWDEKAIRSSSRFSENVVQFMTLRLADLSPQVTTTLQYASVIGQSFELHPLFTIRNVAPGEVKTHLHEAITAGLVLPFDETYLYLLDESDANIPFRFLHDRVHQASYESLTVETARDIHLQLGRYFLQELQTSGEEASHSEKLFSVLNHLNRAVDILTDPKEIRSLVELNIVGAQRSKASGAYEPALVLLRAAEALLGPDSWPVDYQLTFGLNYEQADCLYLVNQTEKALATLQSALLHTTNDTDRLRLARIHCRIYLHQGQQSLTVKTGLDYLSRVGLALPHSEAQTMMRFMWLVLGVKAKIRKMSDEDFFALPRHHDPFLFEILAFFTEIGPALFQASPNKYVLFAIMIFKMIMKNGNLEGASIAYSAYSTILAAGFKDIGGAHRFGKLSLDLTKLFPNQKSAYWKVAFIFANFVQHFKEPIKMVTEFIETAFTGARDAGDFVYAGYLFVTLMRIRLFSGFSLDDLEKSWGALFNFLNTISNQDSRQLSYPFYQFTRALRGLTDDGLEDEDFHESTYISTMKAQGNSGYLVYFYLVKMQLLFHQGHYVEALNLSQEVRSRIFPIKSSLVEVDFLVYDALTMYSLLQTPLTSKLGNLGRAKAITREISLYARGCPENFTMLLQLLLAEQHAYRNENHKAENLYHEAITSAQKFDHPKWEAVACQRLFQFYLKNSQPRVAERYFPEVLYAIERWGATALATALREKYPHFVSPRRPETSKHSDLPHTQMPQTVDHQDFDFSTVLKGAYEISSEIKAEALLKRLLQLSMENAGASRGVYTTVRQGSLRVLADGKVSAGVQFFGAEAPLAEVSDLPVSMLNYVKRTGVQLVLNEVVTRGDFTQDPYILRARPAAALCIPIIHKGLQEGILYLENNLVPHTFTQGRINVLNILTTQAAISIENARLFDELTGLVRASQRFVPGQLFQIINKSLTEAKLGDHAHQEITVLFSDIRSFTALSEKLTPQENFNFINSYLSRMVPVIQNHNGYVDKFLGDGIMALFPQSPEDALKAAITTRQELAIYNGHRASNGYQAIQVGLGIHTGSVMMGIIGQAERFEATVIGDTVNLASRLEGLTKTYQTDLIISENTYRGLADKSEYQVRRLERTQVRGKENLVSIYEVLDGLPNEQLQSRLATKAQFEEAVDTYTAGDALEAGRLFRHILVIDPLDKTAAVYLEKCAAGATERLLEKPL